MKRMYFLPVLIAKIFFITALVAECQHIPFSGNTTLTWQQCIAAYDRLDDESEIAKLSEVGITDGGKPLHLFVINKDKVFYPELFDRNKAILMINNGIHPGEPDGVDASVMLCNELLGKDSPLSGLLDSVIICIIPMYNVDGALNRGSMSRANQEGPAEYGFRGNAKNLDLNRDFIKCDSRNAQSFNQLFTRIRPNVLIDTHVSNGADYPYTMTLVSTQADKLGGSLGSFLRNEMEPALFAAMEARDDKMCHYVNTMGRTPESGIADFMESPRFATGYAALFNTISFFSETHMLKSFDKRVESTFNFLQCVIVYCNDHCTQLVQRKKKADQEMMARKRFAITYELDTTMIGRYEFSGYEAKYRPASVGSGERLYYDKESPWQREINFYRSYRSTQDIDVPDEYVISQAWSDVIERMKWNGVLMTQLKTDSVLNVGVRYIEDYHTTAQPYEGHYLHSDLKVRTEQQAIAFYAGDYVISTSQPSKRYILETLEPQAEDSFFAWNFFDSMLQQKEWFSDYVFEEKAEEILKNDKLLKQEFDNAIKTNVELRENHWEQLYWIYKRSPYYEVTANRYPVFTMKKP